MYIQKAQIKNIRSIKEFEIEFKNPAGWHVLIGDNGAGKSTIIRSMALALIGISQAQGLRPNWSDWLNKQSNKGEISLSISTDFEKELTDLKKDIVRNNNQGRRNYEKKPNTQYAHIELGENSDSNESVFVRGQDFTKTIETGFSERERLFSVAYGPYRRFEGGNSQWEELFKNSSFERLAAHLSVFGEDVALTEAINWLVDLFNSSTDPNFPEEQTESKEVLKNIKSFINWEDRGNSFLPNTTKLESVNSKGVSFKDSNGLTISVNQMSDGYRSVLSMTFELIRQLVRVYGAELVFKDIEKGNMEINLPGVVLVDEIDAHLHPTWQTRIGNWFLKYFPQLQFIVTTHSPLVCRAAEKGSIWRLAAPGSDEKSGEVTGVDRERLIYGNILDAYGTEVFGGDVSISQDSVEKQEEMVKLGKKKMLDKISPEEEEKLEDLKKVFTTDDPIEL